eukprot:scaffold5726_cov116-Isochrysis_galbana.AAC.5
MRELIIILSEFVHANAKFNFVQRLFFPPHTEVVHTVQSPPLQAGSCQGCRSLKGEGDRGLGEIGESEC